MIDTEISHSPYYKNLRASGVKHTFKNAEGNVVSCYGVSNDEADHYKLFVGGEYEGVLENPGKLGWAEVSSFLEGQPDNWTEAFGVSHRSKE